MSYFFQQSIKYTDLIVLLYEDEREFWTDIATVQSIVNTSKWYYNFSQESIKESLLYAETQGMIDPRFNKVFAANNKPEEIWGYTMLTDDGKLLAQRCIYDANTRTSLSKASDFLNGISALTIPLTFVTALVAVFDIFQ